MILYAGGHICRADGVIGALHECVSASALCYWLYWLLRFWGAKKLSEVLVLYKEIIFMKRVIAAIKEWNMQTVAIVLVPVLIGVIGQICLKYGMMQVGKFSFDSVASYNSAIYSGVQ